MTPDSAACHSPQAAGPAGARTPKQLIEHRRGRFRSFAPARIHGQRLRRRQSRSAGSRSSLSEHDRGGQERLDLALFSQADRPSVSGRQTQSDGRLHQSRRSFNPLRQRARVQGAERDRDRRVARLVDRLSRRRRHCAAPCRRTSARGCGLAARIRAGDPRRRRGLDDDSRSRNEPRGGHPPRRSGRPMVVRVHRRRPRRGGPDPGCARLRALPRNNRNGRLS